MGLDERSEILGRNFLLTFQQKLHVNRCVTTGLQVGFEGFEMNKQLPFVVSCTTRIDFAIFLDRFKRRRVPAIAHLCRNHIVMTVHQHGRLIGSSPQPLTVHHGMTSRGDNLDILQIQPTHMRCQPLRSPLHIGGMGRISTHAGNT